MLQTIEFTAFVLGGDTQIRTGGKGFADLCLTAWLCRHINFNKKNGAEDEIRTRDVHLGKVTLYL